MVAEAVVVMVVVEVAEVDVEVSRARTLHLWVEVDAGNCLTYRRRLRQVPLCHNTSHRISGACRLSSTQTDLQFFNLSNRHLRVTHVRSSSDWRSTGISLDFICTFRHHTAVKAGVRGLVGGELHKMKAQSFMAVVVM